MRRRTITAFLISVGITVNAIFTFENNSALIPISVFVIAFLLAYKLTDYLADFKTEKHNSSVDIAFLLIFFILLCIPASNINQTERSVSENRKLAKYPVFIKNNGTINLKFGNQFNNWFNDRFYLREKLIANFYRIQADISLSRFDNNKIFFIKSTNFIGAKYIIPSSKYFSQQDVKETAKSINKINDYCKKNNIKLYIVIVPHNQFIYQELVKPFDNPAETEKVNNAIYALQKSTDAKIIYPFKELKAAAKKDWVYFKTDHHWSDAGAFVAYKLLMKEINEDFPDIKPVNKSDFKIKKSNLVRATFGRKFNEGGQLVGAGFFLLPEKDKILDTEYKYFYHKNSTNLKENIIKDDKTKAKETFYPNGANYRVLELGNSMNENLFPFVAHTFKRVKYYRLVQGETKIKGKDIDKVMKNYGKEIKEYEPEIIIYCTTYHRLKNLKYFFEKN